jgi:hypothetical protein
MFTGNTIFTGSLTHRRYSPVSHVLAYYVSHLLVDVDRLDDLNRASFLIGYNRNRLLGINDRDHGAGDGTPIASHVRGLLRGLDPEAPVARIFMFCYPSVLGKVFNPLTVYFALSDEGQWLAVVYEVNNTFGERHSYVVPVKEGSQPKAEKCLYVSPFNGSRGEYRFKMKYCEGRMRLNIALLEDGELKVAARFDGKGKPLTDRALASGLLHLVVQPLKVVAAIHWEALKLYVKGLSITPRPVHGRFASTVVRSKAQTYIPSTHPAGR